MYHRTMTAARLAISVDPQLAKEIRRAAGERSISAWLADAARRQLRANRLGEVVSDWERENGLLNDAKLEAARHMIRRPPRSKRR